MIRDLEKLEDRRFDIVVIGGGVFGACIARDAALRGLDAAVLEQEDFGHATSANSFKMVHGGIRYIQHGDVPRIRESSRERRAFLRIAPHLVEPLPIVIPTYGHGMRGKELLAAGIWLYDLLTLDRNRGIRDPHRKIPPGRLLGRDRVLEMFPDLPQNGLTGGALFHDAQMYNPTRLVLAFLKGAADHGAVLANYVRVDEFLQDGDRITGVRARDRLSGATLTVRSRMVVNAAGPWAPDLLPEGINRPRATFSRDACFVVPRRLTGREALAVLGDTRDPDALLSRQARHLFLVPWRDSTLVGVWHVVHDGPPDSFQVRRRELAAFTDEVNRAYPAAGLDPDEITVANAGLVLFGEHQSSSRHLSYGKRSIVVDHGTADGVQGLLSVIGVRYTTAPGIARRAVDIAERRIRGRVSKSVAESIPLPGGQIENVATFTAEQASRHPDMAPSLVERLVRNYGTEIDAVLRSDESAGRLGGSECLRAEVIHAVHQEMAMTLGDVVFRRTDLGTDQAPPRRVLRKVAETMAELHGWSDTRIEEEIDTVMGRFEYPMRPVTPALSHPTYPRD